MSDEQDLRAITLIRKGGKHRQQGVSSLYQSYAKLFKAYYIRRGIDNHKAEDLMQETFCKIIRSANTFNGEAAVLKGWLWRIAKNCLIDEINKSKKTEQSFSENQKNDESYQNGPIDPHSEQAFDSAEDCVRTAFDQFANENMECAESLYRVAIEGWNNKEIAEFLDRTLGAAREFVSQCRKKFKPYLEPCRDYFTSGQ